LEGNPKRHNENKNRHALLQILHQQQEIPSFLEDSPKEEARDSLRGVA